MSERLRIAIVTGCLFVIGLHLEQSARLLLEVWRGPYGDAPAVELALDSDSPAPDRGALLASATSQASPR